VDLFISVGIAMPLSMLSSLSFDYSMNEDAHSVKRSFRMQEFWFIIYQDDLIQGGDRVRGVFSVRRKSMGALFGRT
jgi:hypothetical protein